MKNLQYQGLFQPIPPQAAAGPSTPSILWFQPLSEPELYSEPQAYDEFTRPPETTGGTTPAVTQTLNWDVEQPQPAPRRRAPVVNESPWTPRVPAAPDNGPTGIEWHQPFGEPGQRSRPGISQVTWAPYAPPVPDNSPTGIAWHQPFGEPVLGRKPGVSQTTWTPRPVVAPSSAPSGIEWHQPFGLPVYRKRAQYSSDPAWTPRPIATPSNAPVGIEWHQPFGQTMVRRRPAHMDSLFSTFNTTTTVTSSVAGACVRMYDQSLSWAYLDDPSLVWASLGDPSICPGG